MQELPTPQQLAVHPELGALHALDECALLAVRTLIAMHPEIAEDERPYWLCKVDLSCAEAQIIIELVHRLHLAIIAYRHVIDV